MRDYPTGILPPVKPIFASVAVSFGTRHTESMRMRTFVFVGSGALVVISGLILTRLWLAGRQPVRPETVRSSAITNTNTSQVKPTAPPPAPVTIFAAGDIMLDRNVEAVMAREGADFPFASVKSLWQGSDMVFANLEGPITKTHTRTPTGSLRFSFPATTAALLQEQGLTVLSVANNHAYDHGADGVVNTRASLSSVGIAPVGDTLRYRDEDVVTKTIRGQTIVFVAFSSAVNKAFDQTAALALVQRAAIDPTSFVIVSIHWGNEYQLTASPVQTSLGHAFIDAGADLILGHHPHVVQNLEVYRDRLIAYSLGNFIFDQYFSTETQQELALGLELSDETIQVVLYPLQSVRSQPKPMTDAAAGPWLSALAERSASSLAPDIIAGRLTLPRAETIVPAAD